MRTHVGFLCEELGREDIGVPIYAGRVAEKMGAVFGLEPGAAAAAAAVAIKRILDRGLVPDLRTYRRGIYYRAATTIFGESGIDRERLIADKYLLPDIGYETGPAVLHRMGLTAQMPSVRIIATNKARNGTRTDRGLGVVIRPPKTGINAENREHLQVLDVLDAISRAPVDEKDPYLVIARYIDERGLRYGILLALAHRCYNRGTVLRLARAAGAGGVPQN